MIRRVCCAGALVAALVVASVPAAHASTAPSVWATKFCTALVKWQKTVTSESEKASDALDVTAGSDLAAIREEFTKFLSKDVRATNSAIKAINRAGAPDVTNGSKIQAKIVAGFQAASDVFAGAQDDAAALSTTDPTSFVADAQKIESNLNSAADGFTQAFTEVQSLDKGNELEKALEKSRACQALSG
jgi:hypothetical protein